MYLEISFYLYPQWTPIYYYILQKVGHSTLPCEDDSPQYLRALSSLKWTSVHLMRAVRMEEGSLLPKPGSWAGTCHYALSLG